MTGGAFTSSAGPRDELELQILWQRLIAIADECWSTLRRTAFSPIITDALDIGCEVMDAHGSTLAHATRGMPVFNLVLPNVVRHMLAHFAAGEIEDGDVLITNDPWLCAGHLPDIAVITPVFHGAKLIGFVGNIANAADIGGILARGNAQEIYEEGLQIPPLKLARRGRPNDDLLRMIASNVRESSAVRGDLEAQKTANAAAAAGLMAFLQEYGLDELETLAAAIHGYSERGMRAAIAALPDGVYTASVLADGSADVVRLNIAITIRGDEIAVAFPDCPPQVTQGGINVPFNYTRAHVAYILKCILAPDIPSNEGCFRPITVTAPEGSLLNARFPASVGLRTKIGWHVHPLVLTALAGVCPDRIMAPGGVPSWLVLSGYDRMGQPFRDHLVLSGGLGATARADGRSACGFPTMTATVPVEVIESRSPVLIEAKELIPGSGGEGTHRGGLGQRLVIRAHPAQANRLVLSASLDRIRVPAPGLHGGRPGRRSRFAMRKDGGSETEVETGFAILGGDESTVVVEVSGGGGFGAPEGRDAGLRARDARNGYLMPDGERGR